MARKFFFVFVPNFANRSNGSVEKWVFIAKFYGQLTKQHRFGKKNPTNRSFLPQFDGFRIRRVVLERVPVLNKSVCSDWFFIGQDFAVHTVSMETVQSVYFCFGAKPANSKFDPKTAKKVVNIVIQSFSYGPRWAWSVLSQPRTNIPQCDPRAPLVRG